MKSIGLVVISFFLFVSGYALKPKSNFTSVPGSQAEFKTIKIGNQVWMADNLDITNYLNGDPVPEVKSNEEWEKYGNEKKGCWCYFDNNPLNVRYGKMYNYYALTDPRLLVPAGWHVPTEAEWVSMIEKLGGGFDAAEKLKNKTGWDGRYNGTNKSGFSALPGGERSYDGKFSSFGTYVAWWSSTPSNDETAAVQFNIMDSENKIEKWDSNKGFGFYVRCIKD